MLQQSTDSLLRHGHPIQPPAALPITTPAGNRIIDANCQANPVQAAVHQHLAAPDDSDSIPLRSHAHTPGPLHIRFRHGG